MVFPSQAIRKGKYYHKMGWNHEDKVDERYSRLFSRLTRQDYFHIFTHRGTHNWIEQFTGEHPDVIRELVNAINDGDENIVLRNTIDIKEMLASRNYMMKRWFYVIFESTRAIYDTYVNVLKKHIKNFLVKV
jgi:hypothetical protein